MTDNQLQRRSRVLAHLVTVVLAVLLFAVAVELAAFARGRVGPDYLLMRIALPFYLWAIWTVRRMILAVGQGLGQDRRMARLLAQVGIALVLGGVSSVFAAPLLQLVLSGRGAIAHYDVAAITLGVVGLALVVVARLLGEAAAMRNELDEIV